MWKYPLKSRIGVMLAAFIIVAVFWPRKTTLSGQVFIVTQARENIKLGAVEVVLIEKQQVTDFLRQRQGAIDSELQTRESSVEGAALQAVRTWRDVIVRSGMVNYEWGSSVKSNLDTFDEILRAGQWNSKSQDIVAKLPDALEPLRWAQDFDASEEDKRKLDAAISSMKDARSKARLEEFPTADDYLSGLLAAVRVDQRTMTDADGKFSITSPRAKAFTLFATAQRSVFGGTEEYYWLVDAPTGSASSQIFLSNENLAEIDPDGYFSLKPKRIDSGVANP